MNILDTADSTNSHRYAYAVGIPSVTATITQPSWPYLDLGKANIRKGDRITIKGPARFQWEGKDYSIEKLDSVIRDADSLDHDTDPVTDVVQRLQQG